MLEKPGGLAAERANPIDEAKWFDKDDRSDTLCEKRNPRDCLFRRGGVGVTFDQGEHLSRGWGSWVIMGRSGVEIIIIFP